MFNIPFLYVFSRYCLKPRCARCALRCRGTRRATGTVLKKTRERETVRHYYADRDNVKGSGDYSHSTESSYLYILVRYTTDAGRAYVAWYLIHDIDEDLGPCLPDKCSEACLPQRCHCYSCGGWFGGNRFYDSVKVGDRVLLRLSPDRNSSDAVLERELYQPNVCDWVNCAGMCWKRVMVWPLCFVFTILIPAGWAVLFFALAIYAIPVGLPERRWPSIFIVLGVSALPYVCVAIANIVNFVLILLNPQRAAEQAWRAEQFRQQRRAGAPGTVKRQVRTQR